MAFAFRSWITSPFGPKIAVDGLRIPTGIFEGAQDYLKESCGRHPSHSDRSLRWPSHSGVDFHLQPLWPRILRSLFLFAADFPGFGLSGPGPSTLFCPAADFLFPARTLSGPHGLGLAASSSVSSAVGLSPASPWFLLGEKHFSSFNLCPPLHYITLPLQLT